MFLLSNIELMKGVFWNGIGKGRQRWLGFFFSHFALLGHWEELGWLYEPFLFLPWVGKIAGNAGTQLQPCIPLIGTDVQSDNRMPSRI